MTVLETFRVIAKEFSAETDNEVNAFITLSEPMVSKRIFGKFYEQAVAYLTAHRMKMAGMGDSSLGALDDALRVGSYSEGDTSVSFNIGGTGLKENDAYYTLTSYGLMYLQLRRLCVVPIRSAGER